MEKKKIKLSLPVSIEIVEDEFYPRMMMLSKQELIGVIYKTTWDKVSVGVCMIVSSIALILGYVLGRGGI